MAFITPNRKQKVIFGYTLDDFVEPEAKCRFIVALVDRLDLQALYDDYSDMGGKAFDPATLLATWFFAYAEGITSTRKLETACLRDNHFIYVSGNLKPDHTSLHRFRQRHQEVIPDLFVQIIRLAQTQGLSSFKEIAIDGTKIRAAASSKQNRSAASLSQELDQIKSHIRHYLEMCDLLSDEEIPESIPMLQDKIRRLEAEQTRLLSLQDQLEKRQATIDPMYRKSHCINKTDPDARNMKEGSSPASYPSYNAQVSVDTDTQLIVHADVIDKPNDCHQFSRQHHAVEAILGMDSDRQYSADSGYNNLEQLEYAEGQSVDVVMPSERESQPNLETASCQSGNTFKKKDFQYHADLDVYECPYGKILTYRGTRKDRKRRKRQYVGTDCLDCLHRAECLRYPTSSEFRMIKRDEKEYLAEQIKQKASSAEGRARLFRRKTSVEPVIGNLKSNMRFSRFSFFGMPSVLTEFKWMCIGHNLNKLFSIAWDKTVRKSSLFVFLFSIFRSLFGRIDKKTAYWELTTQTQI